MTSSSPDVSIIIVNWNSCRLLRACLSSISEHSHGITCEVIVVDNASFDGSDELVASDFPAVHFIQSDRNLGFAKANNLCVAASKSRNLLFLNPDTEVLEGALRTLVDVIDRRPDAGIVGGKLLNSDSTIQIDRIRAFPSLLNQLLEFHWLKTRFPRLSIWGMRPLFEHSSEPSCVEAVSGACLMIKRKAFEQVGGFDQHYFMYSEDVDLCYKVKQSGWTSFYVPGAQVIHHGGQSSALRPVSQFAAVLIRESRFQFLRRARGNIYAMAYRSITAIVAICRLGALIVVWPIVSLMRTVELQKTISKWVRILRWSLGLERWVKTVG
jgi:N-acetylglucosaminyl-diphospho-decaprenol L-rhamnosyltransferase